MSPRRCGTNGFASLPPNPHNPGVVLRCEGRGQGAVRGMRRLIGLSWLFAVVPWLFAVVMVGIAVARADDAPPPPPVLQVAVFGDSQAQGIAGGLQRVLLDDPRFHIINRTHPGASLIHAESEWFGPVDHFVGSNEKADVAIVMFGANDRLDMRDPKLGYLHFESDAWHDAYAAKVDRILAALAGAHLKIIWCGNPIAKSPAYWSDMSYINGIFEEEVPKYGGTFFPLWSVITDDKGEFAAYGKDRNGVTERLRGDDGIHFTSAGYEIIADKLIALFPQQQAAAQQ
jgi:hypothetical protein